MRPGLVHTAFALAIAIGSQAASAGDPKPPAPVAILRTIVARYENLRSLRGRFEGSAVIHGHERALRGAYCWRAPNESVVTITQADGALVWQRVRSGALFVGDVQDPQPATDANVPPPIVPLLRAIDADQAKVVAMETHGLVRKALVEGPLRVPSAPFVAVRLHLDLASSRLIACELLDARGDPRLAVVFVDEHVNQELPADAFLMPTSGGSSTAAVVERRVE